MKYKKLLIISLMIAGAIFLRGGSASAATKTWDGDADDLNFATAANWDSDTAPSDGDSLVFPVSAAPISFQDQITMNSDFSAAGITFSGDSGSTCDDYPVYFFEGTGTLTLTGNVSSTITGNCYYSTYLYLDIVLGANVTVTIPASQGINFGDPGDPDKKLALSTYNLAPTGSGDMGIDAPITGSGDITSTAESLSMGGSSSSYTGDVSSTGYTYMGKALAFGQGDVTISSGGSLLIIPAASITVANNISLSGAGNGDYIISAGGGQGGCPSPTPTVTLSGEVSIANNSKVSLNCGVKLNITNPNFGNYSLTLLSGSNGTLTIDGKTQTPTYKDTTITDSKPNQGLYISAYYRYFLNGVRGEVSIFDKGILSGTGTAGSINVEEGGILAPGLSPGCLKSGNLSIAGGIYRAELGGTTACSGYDQMKVTGTVSLTDDALLEMSLYNNYKPGVGTKYVIISNDGTDKVSGKFKNLAEGATFTVDGYVLRISYVGGDGNDVEVSVVSVPASPDTGFGLLLNNPALSLGAATLFGGTLLLMSRKLKLATKKVRR